MFRQRLLAVAGAALLAVGAGGMKAGAEEAPAGWRERLDALEQQQKVLERKWEIEQENAAAKAKDAPVLTANAKDGFSLKAADGGFLLKLTGYVHADGRFFLSDEARALTDQFLARRARTNFDGTVGKYTDFRVLTDFAGSAASLLDAYADFKYLPAARLRLGKFKQPFGLERLQSITHALFVELALPTGLAPNRDIGVQLHGDLIADGVLNYAVGVFNGVADGAGADTDTSDNKDFAARLFAHPFKKTDILALKELGLGVAGSIGKNKGTAAATGLSSYRTHGQNVFFSYRSDVVATGDRKRFSPQAYWYPGSLGFLTEYVASTQDVRRATNTATLTHRAWQVAASYVLTGENASYKGVKPRKAFDPKNGGWGAWEIAGRYSEQSQDIEAFSIYADVASAAIEAKASTAGLNWYLNNHTKLQVNYEYTWFVGGASPLLTDRAPERAILSRVQVVF